MTDPKPLIKLIAVGKDFLAANLGGPGQRQQIKALQDIDLTVTTGEAVGIIGDNGAGKTTLLRLMAGTTLPSYGQITRQTLPRTIISLGGALQIQLTGRENIYLYGALLGMLRAEIKQLEASILEFADLTEVADEPLRQYSQGMKMRLAFAVATAGQPKLILLDEVIAAGDELFRHKTRQRLAELRQSGTTIVVSSHDLISITELVSRLILIDDGRIVADGQPAVVLKQYLDATSGRPLSR